MSTSRNFPTRCLQISLQSLYGIKSWTLPLGVFLNNKLSPCLSFQGFSTSALLTFGARGWGGLRGTVLCTAKYSALHLPSDDIQKCPQGIVKCGGGGEVKGPKSPPAKIGNPTRPQPEFINCKIFRISGWIWKQKTPGKSGQIHLERRTETLTQAALPP